MLVWLHVVTIKRKRKMPPHVCTECASLTLHAEQGDAFCHK